MIGKYTCECCGKECNDYPAIGYNAPLAYNWLTEEEKIEFNVFLDSDFCVIKYPEGTDRFIRVVLTQKIIDSCETLEYGFWVTLSEENFKDYQENYNNPNHEKVYFGWLASRIPEYKFDENIPTRVFTQKGNSRPEIVPHDNFNHPFVSDYYNGISKAEAERRINQVLNSQNAKP